VPFATVTNPGADVFPVFANDTHEEPVSAVAQLVLGEIAIVAPMELDSPESADVPRLATETIESARAAVAPKKERMQKRLAATAVRLAVMVMAPSNGEHYVAEQKVKISMIPIPASVIPVDRKGS
jgi:hypothetical protein